LSTTKDETLRETAPPTSDKDSSLPRTRATLWRGASRVLTSGAPLTPTMPSLDTKGAPSSDSVHRLGLGGPSFVEGTERCRRRRKALPPRRPRSRGRGPSLSLARASLKQRRARASQRDASLSLTRVRSKLACARASQRDASLSLTRVRFKLVCVHASQRDASSCLARTSSDPFCARFRPPRASFCLVRAREHPEWGSSGRAGASLDDGRASLNVERASLLARLLAIRGSGWLRCGA